MFRVRFSLASLLLLFLSSGLIYSLITPPFEAPDEVWHYAYVRHLVEKHTLPALDDADSGAYQEVAQPPLYYAAAALLSGFAPDDDLPELMWHNPGFGYQAGGTTNDNKNMLIHTQRERFPWQGAALAIRLARFASLVFGLVTVWAAWGLGREAFPHRPGWALGAATLVAFTPQFLFISGVVSNDSAAAALSTAALWAIARTINHGVTSRRSLVIGLLIGLAALTKTSCLLLGLPAVTVVIFAPGSRLRTHSRRGRRSFVVRHLLLVTLVALTVGGWWYLRNALLYRDPLAISVHVNTPWGRTAPASVITILSQLPEVYKSFWGAFGWGHVGFPSWVYLALSVPLLFSLIGWVKALREHHPPRCSSDTPHAKGVLILAAVWWLLIFAALLQWMRQVYAPHGRLLFPAIGAGAVLVVGGWAMLPRPRSTQLTSIFLTCLVTLSLLTPWVIIRPAFAPPRLTSPANAAATVRGRELIYGNVARLLGVSVDRTSVAPEGRLKVRACWEALAPMEENYTVFVHLVGRDDTRVAERHTYPGLGRFPTSLWPVGQAFCDVYRIRVEDWAPAPELYDLVVGLYEASTGERLDVHDAEGNLVKFPTVAQVRVAPRPPLAKLPDDAHPLDYRLGERITLVGYRLSGTTLQSNAPLTVTLYWRANARPARNYTVFVHLVDETGRLLAQHDGPPRYGRYPTLAWQAGDVIPDQHVLMVPSLPLEQRGELRLVTGMYCSDTMERLPVADSNGALPERLIPLPFSIP